jgi:hypothetical protein
MDLDTRKIIMNFWIVQGGVMESDGQLKKEPRPLWITSFKIFKKMS